MPEITKTEAMALLTQDGNLRVMCSRYGRTSVECASVAYDAALVFEDATGRPVDADLLEEMMGLTVNDSDSIAHLLGDGYEAD